MVSVVLPEVLELDELDVLVSVVLSVVVVVVVVVVSSLKFQHLPRLDGIRIHDAV